MTGGFRAFWLLINIYHIIIGHHVHGWPAAVDCGQRRLCQRFEGRTDEFCIGYQQGVCKGGPVGSTLGFWGMGMIWRVNVCFCCGRRYVSILGIFYLLCLCYCCHCIIASTFHWNSVQIFRQWAWTCKTTLPSQFIAKLVMALQRWRSMNSECPPRNVAPHPSSSVCESFNTILLVMTCLYRFELERLKD